MEDTVTIAIISHICKVLACLQFQWIMVGL